MGIFEVFFIGIMVSIMVACGSKETEIRYGDPGTPGKYTWADIKAKCFTCHPSSAPAIPTTEAEFKASAKVKEEISSGSMPKGNQSGFDKAAALAYLETK